ncbi:MAG: hypothetical protein QOG72_1810 [Sphingomonadales bacterium]|nr:hypothetical protein [Sphingomonadales bacterium]
MKAALRLCLLSAALAALAPAWAQGPAPSSNGQTIVVRGQRIEDTKRALEACLARKCPPLEDMAATLAHAENLFIGGDYPKARSTIEASMRRNERFARQHPLEVATLHRADARISIHLGDGETYRSSTLGAVRALKKGLDENDPTVLTARFEVAEMYARLGRFDDAGSAYTAIAADAAKAGARDLAATAELRRAWLDYREFRSSKFLKPLEKLAQSTDPELTGARLAALVLLARADREQGKAAGPERLLKALADARLDKPTLLWAPPVDVPRMGDDRTPSNNDQTMSTASQAFDKTWADVGFWVKPDGTVSEAEVLRSSGPQGWLKPVLSSIGRRLYSPSPDPAGSYRIERYTWTSLIRTAAVGSRLEQRLPQGRIEYVDLTPDVPEAAAR